MKKKKKNNPKDAPPPAQPITMMEVQEKLGLFSPQLAEETTQDIQEILKNKPLGFI